jgi:hypothetical protein
VTAASGRLCKRACVYTDGVFESSSSFPRSTAVVSPIRDYLGTRGLGKWWRSGRLWQVPIGPISR